MFTAFVGKSSERNKLTQRHVLEYRGYLFGFANKCSPDVHIYFKACINESLCVV